MNSMSRGYYDPCRKEKREEKREEKCPTIIKCGCPASITIPTGTTINTNFTLASLALDTSCLCDPNIKLEFASNLILTGFTGTLSIRVLKQCRNQFTQIPVGPSWTFSAAGVTDARTFSFFVCDSDSCDKECCTYTIVATVTAATTGTLQVNAATLGAIATCRESCNECKRERY